MLGIPLNLFFFLWVSPEPATKIPWKAFFLSAMYEVERHWHDIPL